ncbi:MAG TPA: hypothetical protein VMU13_02210 [Candidatus Paceibacterota bacterium]|nr:hypothetical protein [Candidatus Paceibacterota bacterium]
MEPEMKDTGLNAKLAERFKALPKPVQDAINSADVEEHLRSLATTHKLHLDQWQLLENEVMLTLLGFQNPAELQQSIKDDVGVTDEVATALAADISQVVFEPIREELERELEHPDAHAKESNGVEDVAAQAIASENQTVVSVAPTPPPMPPMPIAPLPTAPDMKSVRAQLPVAYKPGEVSVERKDVHNDPYRESPA